MPKKNKEVQCEICNEISSVIIHSQIYYCADCYIFEAKIPMDKAIQNLYSEGQTAKLKN